MTDWQWKIIIALIKIVLKLEDDYGVYNECEEEVNILKEAVARENK